MQPLHLDHLSVHLMSRCVAGARFWCSLDPRYLRANAGLAERSVTFAGRPEKSDTPSCLMDRSSGNTNISVAVGAKHTPYEEVA